MTIENKKYKVVEDGIEYDIQEDSYGSKRWFLNHVTHRINGPAVEHDNGIKMWFFDYKHFPDEEEYWMKVLNHEQFLV